MLVLCVDVVGFHFASRLAYVRHTQFYTSTPFSNFLLSMVKHYKCAVLTYSMLLFNLQLTVTKNPCGRHHKIQSSLKQNSALTSHVSFSQSCSNELCIASHLFPKPNLSFLTPLSPSSNNDALFFFRHVGRQACNEFPHSPSCTRPTPSKGRILQPRRNPHARSFNQSRSVFLRFINQGCLQAQASAHGV